MQAHRHDPDDPALRDVLALIRAAFAEMEGRIDPPSSVHRLDLMAVAAQTRRGEVWSLGAPPAACLFLTPQPDALYLGKLAVDRAQRRRGLAARLVVLAESRAHALGLARLRLQTRVELTENHRAFRAMSFVETGRTCHPGYRRATSVIFEKPLPPAKTDPGGGMSARA